MQKTCAEHDWPDWAVIDFLPVGTAALYVFNSAIKRAFVNDLCAAIERKEKFLGYDTVMGQVLLLDGMDGPYDADDIRELLELGGYRLLVLNPLEAFKADKEDKKYKNTHLDYFALNRLAYAFKVCILVLPEKRTDAIDFALDTLITFMVPTSADDNAPHRFKVEARDVPPIRGLAAINPASGILEAL